MRYLTLLVLLVTVIGSTHAQSSLQYFKVNFNSDQSSLDQEDISILNKIVAAYKAAPYSEISLTAHTDNNANEAYNMALSKRRAMSVKGFLEKQGVKSNHIIWKHYGEIKPVNTNENDREKAANRRVEIRVESHRFDNISHMMKAAGGNYTQKFTVDPSKPNTIKGKNGSTVTIPANSMVDASGRVITSPVTISLSEFLKPGDAMFQSLSTQTINGEQLETGGMVNIEANAGNKKVMIKKGAEIQVKLPTKEVRPGMELFNARVNSAGVTEWEPTGKPFGAPLNVVKLETADMNEMSFYFKAPRPPKVPYKGIKPGMLRYSSKWKLLSFWDHITMSRLEKIEKMAIHRQQIDIMNKSANERYTKRLKEYAVQRKIYERDSLIYAKRYSASFNSWVDKQIRIQTVFLTSLRSNASDSSSFRNLVAFGADNKIVSASELKHFKKNTFVSNYRLLADKHAAILSALERMKQNGIVTSFDHYGYGDFICSMDNYRGLRSGQNPQPLTASMGLVTIAQATTIEEVAKSMSTSLSEADLNKIEQEVTYSAYISSFGTINCDRFTKTPPEMFVNVTIPVNGQVQVAFYIPSQKSFLYASQATNGYSVRIPKNTSYTLFVMSLDQQQPLFYTEKGEATHSTKITPYLQPATLAFLRDQFQSL